MPTLLKCFVLVVEGLKLRKVIIFVDSELATLICVAGRSKTPSCDTIVVASLKKKCKTVDVVLKSTNKCTDH
eukprot:6012500-Amphidinium_carterae.6